VVTPASGPSFDAFLSYHSGDSAWVAALKDRLVSKGVRVWLDSEQIRPGDRFPGALARAIGDVRSVVVVLSPGSVRSPWVEEEYSLALARRCHVIAVLFDDVEPPGFLEGRTWVDFRDEAQYETSLDQLVFGITGERAGPPGEAPSPAYRDPEPLPGGTDEAAVLERLIARRRQERRRLWRARGLSAVVGVALGAAFFLVAAEAAPEMRIGVGVMAPLILTLSAWGVTATGLTRLESKVEQFETLRDGLEACRSRSHPGCKKIRQHFWNLMEHIAAEATASQT
jgi:hypothetical protein